MLFIKPALQRPPSLGKASLIFALGSAGAAWGLYLALAVIRCVVFGFPRPLMLIERHLLTAVVAVALSGLVYLYLRRLEGAPFRSRLIAALLCAMAPATLLSVINYNVMVVFAPPDFISAMAAQTELHASLIGQIVHSVVENYFVFSAWAILYTAVSNALQSQDLLRRTAVAEAAARTAELRALRYQLDPHFLFNTLNTVSGLMLDGDIAGADHMVEALASFMRTTLSLDASEDITLAEEMELQRRYLGIEQVRFGDRLRVDTAVSDAAGAARVPALLLQPIVENSVRHGVARSTSPMRLNLSAWTERNLLHILAENDGPSGPAAGGHGVGLANVVSRLALRFGTQALCEYGPRGPQGFFTKITLPLDGPAHPLEGAAGGA